MKFSTLSLVFTGLVCASAAWADVAQDLAALVAPSSDAGPAITSSELQTFTQVAQFYSAEEAIQGISFYEVLKFPVIDQEASDPRATSVILQALRLQVPGLSQPISRFPGLSWSSCGAQCLGLRYESLTPIAGITLVYSFNEWRSTGSVNLTRSSDKTWNAVIKDPLIAEAVSLRYAVRLTSPDGRRNWFNNPREQVNEVRAYHLNYFVPLQGLEKPYQEARSNPFLALLHAYTLNASDGQEVFTSNEFSSLVEQLTWFGGTDLDTWTIASDISRELAAMQASGIVFEAGVYEYVQNFLSSALGQSIWATYPAAQPVLLASGQTALRFYENQLKAFELIFSTDAWNTVLKTSCSRDQDSWLCPLGAVPLSVPIAYRPHFTYSNGQQSRPTVSGSHPFFHELK